MDFPSNLEAPFITCLIAVTKQLIRNNLMGEDFMWTHGLVIVSIMAGMR